MRVCKRLAQGAGAAVVYVGDRDDVCVSGYGHDTNQRRASRNAGGESGSNSVFCFHMG